MIIEKCVYDINGTIVNTVAQWDNNVAVYISDPGITKSYPCHFFSTATSESLIVSGSYANGKMKVVVPNILLQYPYPVIGYVYVSIDGGNRSIYRFRINVAQKPKPTDYTGEIAPDKTINITSNGTYPVTAYDIAVVEVNPTGKLTITENGNDIDVKDYATVDVIVNTGSGGTSPSYTTAEDGTWGGGITNSTQYLITGTNLNKLAEQIQRIFGLSSKVNVQTMIDKLETLTSGDEVAY